MAVVHEQSRGQPGKAGGFAGQGARAQGAWQGRERAFTFPSAREAEWWQCTAGTVQNPMCHAFHIEENILAPNGESKKMFLRLRQTANEISCAPTALRT